MSSSSREAGSRDAREAGSRPEGSAGMNDFHFYEVVGRSKHSVVYKGRQKKTIQYYGVKSVDKSQRPYILQEVKILHSLKHPNVMGFYSWYESTNHLWLILEYCVGGDLLTLLRQDKKLPETSIHDFGRDLLSAMHALHSNGILHCDLKPSNILLDENGRVKLGGFGLARTVVEIVKRKDASSTPSLFDKNKRGTPCYMAPELLVGDFSCHSFASDFWSLGCILYECAMGQPPFVSSSLNVLVDSILHKDVHLPSYLSQDFRDLLKGCLDKNPLKRLGWKEVVGHRFWKSKMKFEKIPSEAIFATVLKDCGYLSTSQEAERGKPGDLAAEEGKENRVVDTNTGGGAKSVRAKDEDRQRTSNVLRLSRIAKKNLQTEDPVDYGSISNDDSGDVKLENADTELDFTEESTLVPAGKPFPCDSESTSTGDSGADPSDSREEEDSEQDMRLESTSSSNADRRKMAIERELSSSALDDSVGVSHQEQDHTQAALSAGASGEAGYEPRELNAVEMAFHSSDLLVKPIVGNRRIEKKQDFQWDAFMLPFEPITLQEMLEFDQERLETFLSIVYKTVASSSSVSERLNVLAYFGGLCKDSNSANVIINSSLLHMFVTKLRGAKVANLKTHFACVLGTLIRHATFIGSDVPKTGIIDALTECVRDKSEVVRRKSMAALGELLFYIVTQHQEEAERGNQKPDWYVPNGTVTTIFRLLRNVEDPVTQHYAVKTLENIFSIGGEWALRLGTVECALSLVHICANAKSDHVKVTASSALARLYRCNTEQAQVITDKIGMKAIVGFLKEGNAKVQQHFGSIFIIALANASNKSKNALSDEKHLGNTLMHLLDHSSNVIRGKIVICTVQLSKLQIQWLIQMSNAKLIGMVERLKKIQDQYVEHSVAFFQASMPGLVESLVTQISEGVEKLCGRRSSAQRSRTYQSSSLSSLSHDTLLGCKALLAIITSTVFRLSCASGKTVTKVGDLVLKVQKGPPALVSEIKNTVFNILEAMSQHGDLLLSSPGDILGTLFPVLAVSMVSSQSGDTRFLCAKLLCDMVLFYISEVYGGEDGEDEAGLGERAQCKVIEMEMGEQIRESILPNLPALLEDEDPIPLYSLKMLIAVLDFDPTLTEQVAELGLVPLFVSYLSLDHPNNNVHNLRLCKIMTASEAVALDDLLGQGIVEMAARVLSYTCENMVEAFMEPSLELCCAIAERAVGEGRRRALAAMADECMQKILGLGKHSDSTISELAGKCAGMLSA